MNSRSMAGWIGFAGIVMVILGVLSFFEGLIALLRDNYYVPTASGYLLFDVTGWGWINIFSQLGFLGNTNDTLWLLITLTLNIIVLYALIVRWDESVGQPETR